jgi:hypothetical protein
MRASCDSHPNNERFFQQRRYYAVHFHPEVMHMPDGAKLSRNFAAKFAGCSDPWTIGGVRELAMPQIGTRSVVKTVFGSGSN